MSPICERKAIAVHWAVDGVVDHITGFQRKLLMWAAALDDVNAALLLNDKNIQTVDFDPAAVPVVQVDQLVEGQEAHGATLGVAKPIGNRGVRTGAT